MKVLVKKTNENAVIPFKHYDSDFCYDVTAISEEEIAPNVWKYGLGIAMQIKRCNEVLFSIPNPNYREVNMDYSLYMPKDFKTCCNLEYTPINFSIDFRPRSSVWKTGMVLSNCQGTIDEGYTNEISAIFYHVFQNMPRYKVSDRIGQIKIGAALPIEFIEVEELKEKDRGLNGWGSTNQ